MYKLSEKALHDQLRSQGAYKERSSKTHDDTHLPQLQTEPTDAPVKCLLLGCSMIERFKTSGSRTPFGRATFPRIFNAGVGGDRVRNVLYRLEFAVLQLGTNDLRPKKALESETIEKYALVLEAVRRLASENGIKILVTGLMLRKDTKQEVIDESNSKLQLLVERMNKEQEDRTREEQKDALPGDQSTKSSPPSEFYYMSPAQEIALKHLADHVHLKPGGYELFSNAILEAIEANGIAFENDKPVLRVSQ